MWGFASGAKISHAKVVFVKKLILLLDEYVAFHGVWCKPPKLIINELRLCGANHHKVTSRNPWCMVQTTKNQS